MATKSLNRVFVETATVGAGTVTLGAATAANALTFLQAGAADNDRINYVIEEGADFEIGNGTIGGGGTTLTRDTVHISKVGATVSQGKMNLGGAAKVRSAEDADFFNHMFPTGESVKTAAYTIDTPDHNKILICNNAGATTFSLASAASLGVFAVMVRNIGAGALTIDPNGTETVDGASTIILAQGQSVMIFCNGTEFRTLFWSRSKLSELADVDLITAPPTSGQGLVWNGTKYVPGAAGGGKFYGSSTGVTGNRPDDIFRANSKVLSYNVTIAGTENASAAGPLEIATGVVLEVSTGATLTII